MKDIFILLLALICAFAFLFGLTMFFIGLNSSNPDAGRYGNMIGLPLMIVFGILTRLCWRKVYS